MKWLESHRSDRLDTIGGRTGSWVHVGSKENNSGVWTFERVGSLDEYKCIIRLKEPFAHECGLGGTQG